jgi:acyl carrier protein
MTSAEIKAKTRAFMARSFRTDDLNDSDEIFALGLVNSLFAMQLVMFVEKEFQISIGDEDLTIDNFRSVDAIAALVAAKTA